MSAFTPVRAVDPVPWARAQMAFTLASHIILVPLGVSWAAMTLLANYKAVKHDDAATLAVLFIFPAFALLHALDQRGLLPEEGLDEPLAAEVSP
jgi:hypothetical protein